MIRVFFWSSFVYISSFVFYLYLFKYDVFKFHHLKPRFSTIFHIHAISSFLNYDSCCFWTDKIFYMAAIKETGHKNNQTKLVSLNNSFFRRMKLVSSLFRIFEELRIFYRAQVAFFSTEQRNTSFVQHFKPTLFGPW